MRARPLLTTTLALAVALAATATRAAAGPDVVGAVGATTAVDGALNSGGASVSLSLLWPLENRFRFGMMGSADDLGIERTRLVAPDGTDLGPIPGHHRATLAAVWRFEVHPGADGAWDPYAAATWGMYRMTDDLHGDATRRLASAGFGLGLGLARRLTDAHAAGLAVRYQWLTRGDAGKYLSAAVEWRWRPGATK